jgi:hypothetical protein
VTLQAHYEHFCKVEKEIFVSLGKALPFPSPMTCAVQGAAYLFLCNILLAKKPQSAPEPRPDPKHPEPKGKDAPSDKPEEVAEESIPGK